MPIDANIQRSSFWSIGLTQVPVVVFQLQGRIQAKTKWSNFSYVPAPSKTASLSLAAISFRHFSHQIPNSLADAFFYKITALPPCHFECKILISQNSPTAQPRGKE
eukprot:EG_transcript_37530